MDTFVVLPAVTGHAHAQQENPNIVFILVDNWGFGVHLADSVFAGEIKFPVRLSESVSCQ